MKQKENLFIIFQLSLILFIFLNANSGWGVDVKLTEKIEFSPETELPLNPKSFCVTEDELFIIPDYSAGNMKIYEKNGDMLELIKIIGRKGYGPDEFVRPGFCFYNKDKSKFGVLDFGIRKIFIYDRIRMIEFKRVKEVTCWEAGYDIQLRGEKLFISGYKPDQNGNPYDFYCIDLNNDQTTFLLPSNLKYGLRSLREYEDQYLGKPDIRTIGIKGWFDIYKDNAFFVWEGNLKVIKLNIVTGKIEPNPFGNQPPHFVKPYVSQELFKSRLNKDLEQYAREKSKMSYVRNIFVSSRYVLVIYEGPVKQDKKSNYQIQLYTLDGNFVRELPISIQPDPRMWFDRERDILYSLSNKSNVDRVDYFILKLTIFESGGYP